MKLIALACVLYLLTSGPFAASQESAAARDIRLGTPTRLAKAAMRTGKGKSRKGLTPQAVDPACIIYEIYPSRLLLDEQAYSSEYSFFVDASDDCQISASSDNSWATISTPTPFHGSGYLGLSVTANDSTTARAATISFSSVGGVGTASAGVLQSGSGCQLSLAETSSSIGPGGGTITLQVLSTPSNCATWEASGEWWAAPSGETAGSGSGNVTFAVLPNPWNSPRVGFLEVGGLSHVLTQAGAASGTCVPKQTIQPLVTVNGTINAESCPSLFYQDAHSSYLAEQYTFQVTAGTRVAVVSTNIGEGGAYLTLADVAGSVLYSNYRRLPASGHYTLPVDGEYTLEVMMSKQQELGDYSITLLPECDVTLSQTAAAIPSTGGPISVEVTASGCTWDAVASATDETWLTLHNPLLNSGSSTLEMTAAANGSPDLRYELIIVGDQYLWLTQSGTGTSTIFAPSSTTIPATGASHQTVNVATTALYWHPLSTQSWLTIEGWDEAAGSILYSIAQNQGPSRSAEILIGDSGFALNQQENSTASSRVGIFRQGFYWLQDVNGDRQFRTGEDIDFAFGGIPGDIPLAGDWNGDGKTEIGIYRPVNGLFILDFDNDRQIGPFDRVFSLGIGTDPGDLPIVGDWNGSGRDKVGIFRQGFLWILDSDGNEIFVQGSDDAIPFGGVPGDVPVVGDWDGDGRDNLGLFREGYFWILDRNGNGVIDQVNEPNGDLGFPFGGLAGDLPLVGDWSGTGADQVGFFRQGFLWVLDSNGDRMINGSGPEDDLVFGFGGIAGDIPVVGAW